MRFFKHLFSLLFYLAVLLGGMWGYENVPTFQTKVNIVAAATQNTIANIKSTITGESSQSQQTSTATSSDSNTSSGRWTKNSATIYINIKNQTLNEAMQEAIANWNATGVFTFTIVSNKKAANIIATTMSKDNQAAGLTDMSINTTTGYFISGHVYLNSAYLLNAEYGYSKQRIVNTAEHELGHAIGLSHSNAISVMQPAGSNYTIQQRDINAVNKLYSTSSSSSSK